MELIQGNFGPQLLNLLIDSEEVASVLAKKFGVPDTLIRDEADRKQLAEMMTQMAQQQQQQDAPITGTDLIGGVSG
jgi:hypothetical protein